MKRLANKFSIYLAIGLVFFGFAAQQTTAQQQRVRRSERDVREIMRSLTANVEDFQYGLTYQLENNSADEAEIDRVNNDLRTLQKKISDFRENFNQKRENADDVSEILAAARSVDSFLVGTRQNRRIQSDWEGVRNLLDRLAANYGLSWNAAGGNSGYPDDNYPNDNRYPPRTNRPRSNYPPVQNNYGLTGTYQLDASRSENTSDIVQNSQIGSDTDRDDLAQKLAAPEQIALDVRGNRVTLASSKAAPVTFTADGQTRTENSNGRTVRVRAALSGNTLTVASLGGETDYTITFVSEDGGQSLKVTRRITTDYLDQTVFADSFYSKTEAVARLGIENGVENDRSGGNYPNGSNLPDDDNGNYSSSEPDDRGAPNNSGYPTATRGNRGDYIVPNGTVVSGILENYITTKVSQNNDRFRMTVQSPDEFRGAVIEGYVSGINRSGKVTGRSQITFNFERITLRSGQTYDFAGYLQSVTDTNGKTVRVDTEGAAKGDSQTKQTAKRGGIGAGIGAVIGAIAGGVKGAAIGAIIGGGAGAGSVVLQGKDDLDLKEGSTITVQASSPLR